MTKEETTRAIELLKEVVAQATTYATTEDNLDSYMDLPRWNSFIPTIAWDGLLNSYTYEEDASNLNDCQFDLWAMHRLYGYKTVEAMLADIYDHVTVESYYASNSFYHFEYNKIEWLFAPISEVEESISDSELFTLLTKATIHERNSIANVADCVIQDCGDTSINIVIYLGGAVVVFSEMKLVLQYLNNRLIESM